jgi:hypothetical protein
MELLLMECERFLKTYGMGGYFKRVGAHALNRG